VANPLLFAATPEFLKHRLLFCQHPVSQSILHEPQQTTGKMSWRNQGITGSNNIPLGKRRFGADGEEDGFTNGSASSMSPNGFANGDRNGDRDVKRGRSPERMLTLVPFLTTSH
jgi:hypothetical protein